MKKEKYYLITYLWQHPKDNIPHYTNQVINEKPCDWLSRVNKQNPEQYFILYSTKITMNDYEKYKHTF